jgi:hypothetical protein
LAFLCTLALGAVFFVSLALGLGLAGGFGGKPFRLTAFFFAAFAMIFPFDQ